MPKGGRARVPPSQKITIKNGKSNFPSPPPPLLIKGQETPPIWRASVRVFDAAVQKAYGGKRKIPWLEVYAGEKAFNEVQATGCPTRPSRRSATTSSVDQGPADHAGRRRHPLAERRAAPDARPLRLPAPGALVQGRALAGEAPEKVDMVIFRENTEDIYAGIEFEPARPRTRSSRAVQAGVPEGVRQDPLPGDLGHRHQARVAGRHRAAVPRRDRVRDRNKRKSVTLVHKGNIMKFTEGAFRNWGYALAESASSRDKVYTWDQWERTKAAKGEKAANAEQTRRKKAGKVLIKDAIADITLQQVLTRPDEFDVIATLNLNGDYLSDALAAQVGGIGIAPGGNINYVTGHAVFEATHGTAPKYAEPGQGEPGLGDPLRRDDAALHGLDRGGRRDHQRMDKTIGQKTVTYDFAQRAPQRFESRDWRGSQRDAVERIELYDKCVDGAVEHMRVGSARTRPSAHSGAASSAASPS